MILVQHLHIQRGSFCLTDLSFEIPTGCYGVLMGKTGCGKSTLMETICGLCPAMSGTIVLGGRDVTQMKPAQRGIGYVPQDGALFSTMTVFDHLAFALRIRKWKPRPIEDRVRELADELGIAHILQRLPPGLSGGEAQRVALGRALAFQPAVLLLDEPLSALDEETRHEMYTLLRRIRERYRFTALHVTHSGQEAKELADRVFVMKHGLIMNSDEKKKLDSVETASAYPGDPA